MSSRWRKKGVDATSESSSMRDGAKDGASLLASSSWTIVRWTVLHRLAVLAVLLASATVQKNTFDTSPALLISLDSASSADASFQRLAAQHLVRWDTLHFLGVASPRALPSSSFDGGGSGGGGLRAEHSLAFQPAVLWLLRIAGRRAPLAEHGVHAAAGWSAVQAVLLTSLMATAVSVALPILFYRLTLQTVRRHRTAKLAALLSILSAAPATLVTPTPEAFFALFALLGHICLTFASSSLPRQPIGFALWTLLSSCMFGVASAFRSNGILLLGFLPWHLIWLTPKPNVSRSLLFRALLLVVASVMALCLPALPQVWAYHRFCRAVHVAMSVEHTRRPWCSDRLPIAYTFVQKHYWNNGFLRYWTLAQTPNWILAAPVLGLVASYLVSFYSADVEQVVRRTLVPSHLSRPDQSGYAHTIPPVASEPRFVTMTVRNEPHLLGHAHYTLVLLSLLTLTSHVQIALRFGTPGAMPVLWWSAAALVESRSLGGGGAYIGKARSSPTLLRIGLVVLVLWNATSVVLYAGFYPPA